MLSLLLFKQLSMKPLIFGLGALYSGAVVAFTPITGDIIFQTSKSAKSIAVQKATDSPYSHMGMIVYQNQKPYVIEAVQPVKYTELQQWIARGEGQHYVVKRLKQPLTITQLNSLEKHAKQFLGKPYDLGFEWSDNRIYCSELIWKVYKQAIHIELAPLAKLGSFNLNDPVVKDKLKERYGNNIPLNEAVISPAAIFDSKLLDTVSTK